MEYAELEFVSQALEGKPVSLVNELRAMRASINALTSVLKSYSTTLAQDKELMENEEAWNKLSVNVRNAVILRKSQKEILINNSLVLSKMWENILLSGELHGGIAI